MSHSINETGIPEVLDGLATTPLTPTQRDLYLDHLLNPGSTTFNIATSLWLPQPVDAARWEAALRTTIGAQPITRTLFTETSRPPLQYIQSGETLYFERQHHAAWSVTDIRSFIEHVMAIPMDPIRGPLFKNYLFQTNRGDCAAVVTQHLLFDGISMRLFFEQVWQTYLVDAAGPKTPIIVGDFFDYACRDFAAFDAPETKVFWQQRCVNVTPLELHQHRSKPSPNRYYRIEISTAATANIRACLAQHNYRLPAFFLTLYGILLQRYTDHADDFVIRTITAGRPAEFIHTLGCFYQTVPYVFPTELVSGRASRAQLFEFTHDYRRRLGENQNISVLLLNTLLQHERLKPCFNFQIFAASQTFSNRAMQVYMSHPPDELHLAVTDLRRRDWAGVVLQRAKFPRSTISGTVDDLGAPSLQYPGDGGRPRHFVG